MAVTETMARVAMVALIDEFITAPDPKHGEPDVLPRWKGYFLSGSYGRLRDNVKGILRGEETDWCIIVEVAQPLPFGMLPERYRGIRVCTKVVSPPKPV